MEVPDVIHCVSSEAILVVGHQNVRSYLRGKSVVANRRLPSPQRVENPDFRVVIEEFVVVTLSQDQLGSEKFEILLGLNQLFMLKLALLLQGINHLDIFGLTWPRFESLLKFCVLLLESQQFLLVKLFDLLQLLGQLFNRYVLISELLLKNLVHLCLHSLLSAFQHLKPRLVFLL